MDSNRSSTQMILSKKLNNNDDSNQNRASVVSKDLEWGAPTISERNSTTLQDVGEGDEKATASTKEELPATVKEAASPEQAVDDKAERVIFEPGPIPDGGYGWVIVLCQFFSQLATWGMLTVYGVYISWFKQHNTYPGASVEYAWIAGAGASSAFFISPLTSYLCKRLPLRVNLAIAQTLIALGFVLAGFSGKIWQLALTQGVMAGIGVGWNFMATQPLISQWFQNRRALAMGLGSGGVGAGGLIFSFTTRAALAAHGVRISYIINGVIIFVVLTPTTFLFKPRMRIINPKPKPVNWGLLRNGGVVMLCLWAFFVMLGYMIPLLSVAIYSTAGIGLTQAQGASIQAIMAAGQLVGRPSLGLVLDFFGRINMGSVVTFLAGITCLCIWMFAKSYGLMIFFAFVNGMASGIFFSAIGPLLSEIVGLKYFSDGLAIIWMITGPIVLGAVPIAFALNNYSQNVLHRTGVDIFQIGIAVAGGANVVAAIALFAAKKFQRTDKD